MFIHSFSKSLISILCLFADSQEGDENCARSSSKIAKNGISGLPPKHFHSNDWREMLALTSMTRKGYAAGGHPSPDRVSRLNHSYTSSSVSINLHLQFSKKLFVRAFQCKKKKILELVKLMDGEK